MSTEYYFKMTGLLISNLIFSLLPLGTMADTISEVGTGLLREK